MHLYRILRSLLITTFLILGPLLSMVIGIPHVGAEPIIGETTFYFTNALSYDFEDSLDFDFGYLSLDKPTNQNDSKYPPCFLRKNASKDTLLKREINSEEMGYWLLSWTYSILFDTDLGNLSDYLGGFIDDIKGLEILLPHPYRIVQGYEYAGNETLEVNGDIVFDLYFASTLRQKLRPRLFKDDVKVGVYKMDFFLPKEIKNISQQIKTGGIIQNCIPNEKIIIENVNFSLNPGETLFFSIELIQSNKSNVIGSIIKKRVFTEERILKFLNVMANRWNKTTGAREKIGLFLKDFIPLIEELNFTVEDIENFLDTFRSSSLVYNSEAHPSSVTLDFILPGSEDNTKIYYLHNEDIMDTNEPTETQESSKLSNNQIKWNGPTLDKRNKIIKDVTVDLYIKCPILVKPSKIQVAVTLFDDDNEIPIDPVIKSLENSNRKPQNPTSFSFEDVNYELAFGHSLGIGVSLVNNIGISDLRNPKILYDSMDKPSSVKVIFSETDNINFNYVSDPDDGLIIPGGSVKYTLNINSENDDDLSIEVLEDKVGEWNVKIIPKEIKISADKTGIVNIFVNSTNNRKEAYGNIIDMTFVVSGKTGIDRKKVSAEISESAIQYDLEIVNYTKSKFIDRGKNGTFNFIIQNKNTGATNDVDSYTINAISKNNWNIKHTTTIKDLRINEKTGKDDIIVIVSVPENTSLKSDTITFTVLSDNGDAFAEVNVTVDILDQGFFESIYDFFESTSNSLGLKEIFGVYAPIALVSLLMIIILFITIILALLLTRKFINIICTERIQEIDPNGKATFSIILENPSRKSLTYNISTDRNPSSPKWEKFIDTNKIKLNRNQNKTILLTVKPTEYAEPEDWTETKFKVNVSGKRKTEEITTMTLLKKGKSLLRITDVFTWPKEFKKGDRIITSFKLENKGSISAKNVKTVLLINGKEKNKVEVTIPSGGYADIKMPWIALKGKNTLHIKTIEQ